MRMSKFSCFTSIGSAFRQADLVTYWFEKARAQVASGQTKRVGLVATNSIRGEPIAACSIGLRCKLHL